VTFAARDAPRESWRSITGAAQTGRVHRDRPRPRPACRVRDPPRAERATQRRRFKGTWPYLRFAIEHRLVEVAKHVAAVKPGTLYRSSTHRIEAFRVLDRGRFTDLQHVGHAGHVQQRGPMRRRTSANDRNRTSSESSAKRVMAPWACGRPPPSCLPPGAPAHKAHRARPSSARPPPEKTFGFRSRRRLASASRGNPTERGAAVMRHERKPYLLIPRRGSRRRSEKYTPLIC
jgi:hypothetical protein